MFWKWRPYLRFWVELDYCSSLFQHFNYFKFLLWTINFIITVFSCAFIIQKLNRCKFKKQSKFFWRRTICIKLSMLLKVNPRRFPLTMAKVKLHSYPTSINLLLHMQMLLKLDSIFKRLTQMCWEKLWKS